LITQELAQKSIISQTFDIHSLYIISKLASLNGGAILFFITFAFVKFQLTSFSIHTHFSIFALLLTSIL
jgi:hypothetical protein